MLIAITDTEALFANYPRWIMSGDERIELVTLRPESRKALDHCDGIVLSGGVDTHPKFYNNPVLNYPNAPEAFDEIRDGFELEVFNFALEHKIPLLAICRGMQLANIAMGGDIIQDIEASGKPNHRRIGTMDGMHKIEIVKDSLLNEIVAQGFGTVNSAHHQAVGRIADAFIVNCQTADGLVEGLEWKEKAGKNFFLGVQWHPERLVDLQPSNPMNRIRKRFIDEVARFKKS
jgi:putative glutamine amidotransferase